MRKRQSAAGGLAALALAAGMSLAGCSPSATSRSIALSPQNAESTAAPADKNAGTLSASHSSAGVDWSALPTTEVSLTDDGLTITEAGTYILTGSSTGQVVVNSDGNVRIVLHGATIMSAKGAAVQVDAAKLTVLDLAEGTSNSLSDKPTRTDNGIDGTIYSAGKLIITGTGSLDVDATAADGIVSTDHLTFESGNITVTGSSDGIQVRGTLTIAGGTISVEAAGDGIKANNDADLGKGQLNISGGHLTISARDAAIKAEQKAWIGGGTVEVTTAAEGFEAPVIVIDDGTLTIIASDEGIKATASAIITTGIGVTINGGDITIVMGAGDTDGIGSDGDLIINGGTIDVTGQSPFDYDGACILNGGTIIVNGERLTELPSQMRGAGRGQMGVDGAESTLG